MAAVEGTSPSPLQARVRLRPVVPEDVAQFLVWARDPEVRRHYLGEYAARNTDDDDLGWVPGHVGDEAHPVRREIGTSRPAGRVVRSVETLQGLLLGWIELRDLNWRRRTGELRICLGDRETWGHGYGPEAIDILLHHAFVSWGLRSVHLRVATWNSRAVRAYRRCGFRREARLCAGRRTLDGLEDLWLMTATPTPP